MVSFSLTLLLLVLQAAASVLQLPSVTIDIPVDYTFQNATYRRQSRNILVEVAHDSRQYDVVLRDLPFINPRCTVDSESDLDFDDVEFSMKFALDRDVQRRSVLVLFREGDDATATAREVAELIGMDELQTAWLSTALDFGRGRHQLPEFAKMTLVFKVAPPAERCDDVLNGSCHYASGVEANVTISIREGDDLSSLMEWLTPRHGLPWRVRDALASLLQQNTLIPWGAPSWLKARSRNTGQSKPAATMGFPMAFSPFPCVFVGITSCKRFELFNDTMSQLLRVYGLPRSVGQAANPHSLLCRITVVDDASSLNERQMMLQEFGDVAEFVFTEPNTDEGGHATSLNKLVTMAFAQRARYFLYLEDDWSLVETNPVAISEALSILQLVNGENSQDAEPLVQIHLNSQSAKNCAKFDRSTLKDDECQRFIAQDSSGWPRDVGGHKYQLHEWGFPTRPPLQYSGWPGFTLNPAVWDLALLTQTLGRPSMLRSEDTGNMAEQWFNVSSNQFERQFSQQIANSGLRVGYLDQLTFRHTGVGNFSSAYALMQKLRPWDTPHATATATQTSYTHD